MTGINTAAVTPSIPDNCTDLAHLAKIYADFCEVTGLPHVDATENFLRNDIGNHLSAWIDAFILIWEDAELADIQRAADQRAADRLAASFSAIVRDELNDELPEIVRRNNANAEACATHDFCDANELMQRAFISVFRRDILPDHGGPLESDMSIWNAAWATAQKSGFKI